MMLGVMNVVVEKGVRSTVLLRVPHWPWQPSISGAGRSCS
jgi:hypothetical protein